MKKFVCRTLWVLFSLLCITVVLPSWAQDSTTRVTVDILQGRIAAAQESGQLDDPGKARLIDLYRQSISNLQTADANQNAFEDYRQVLRTAPAETEQLRASIELRSQSDPLASLEASATAPVAQLVRTLDEELANQTAVEAKLAVLEARLESDTARPSEARQRIAAARAQMEELASQGGDRPAGEQTAQLAEAGRWAAQTRLESLQTEIAMLDQELLSYTVRNDLLRAQRDESALSLSRINERVDALREIITERRRLENERAMAQAQAALEGELANEPLVRELAQANLALVLRLQGQLAELDSLAARERSRPRVVQIEGAFRSARRKLDLVGTGAPVGLAVLRERRQFPSAREYAVERRVIGRSTTAVSLRLVETEEERRMLNDVTVYVDGRIAEAGAEPMSAEAGIALKNLAESRRSLLERAIANDNALQQRLYALDDAMQRLGDRTNSYDDYLSERLLWVRSTRPIDTSALTQLPRQVARYLAPAQWLDVARFATQRLIEAPAFLLILLAGFALAWRRKQLRNGLLECGSVVGRIRQDTMTKTIEALGYTLLLAAPVPLILAAVGGGLATAPEGPDFPNSVGLALLLTAAWLSLPITIRVLFGAGGVAERHFGWDGPTLKRIGQQLDWFLIVAFPAYFVTLTATTVESQTGAAIHGLTMFAFVILMASLVALVVGLAHPRTGPVQKLLAAQTGSRWWRWRSLWFSFLILTPIGLLALALFGFTYTAEELTRRLFQSIWFLIAVGLGAALVRRWLLLTGRRLAFQAAKTAREAARLRALADSGAEPMIEADVAAPEVDLVALGADSRQLLNATTLVVAALGLAGIWGTVIPALGILDEYSLWSRTALVDGVNQLVPVTLATLLLALVVVVGSYVLATNLPSLLDIILLKQGSVSAGGRYTIATLTRYTVTAISVLLVLRLLGVNASQLGWAAAALGVGIGFGLQEIVANFICGLILLFERPIRVGDTITVGEASGTVTQIRIRATTIRDWDQKELVVPNKELITGRLLNWSLSDSVTRLSITVGVAYGSDVDRAMDLIREAADENDHVVDDPSPSVHFERFADSSLNLTLRAFVGQLSERLQTITELHKAIDKKFREAGIVIAFPQRDLHIYTSDQSAPAPGPAGLQEVKGTAGR